MTVGRNDGACRTAFGTYPVFLRVAACIAKVHSADVYISVGCIVKFNPVVSLVMVVDVYTTLSTHLIDAYGRSTTLEQLFRVFEFFIYSNYAVCTNFHCRIKRKFLATTDKSVIKNRFRYFGIEEYITACKTCVVYLYRDYIATLAQ